MKQLITVVLFAIAIALCPLGITDAAAQVQDQNLHTLVGTMDSCGCTCFTITPPPASGPTCDWICHAHFVVAAPSPHWDECNPAFINAEIVEQSLGQCNAMQPTLPRKVQMLYWLEAHGYDFVHGLIRSPIRGYYLTDLGPAQ